MSKVAQKYEDFRAVSKLIIKTNLSKNHGTLTKYRKQIIPAYNVFIEYIAERYEKVDDEGQKIFDQWLQRAREKFVACLNALECTHSLPTIYEYVNDTHVGPVPEPTQPQATESDTDTDNNTDRTQDSYEKASTSTAHKNASADVNVDQENNSNKNNKKNNNSKNNSKNKNNERNMGDMTPLELFNVVNRQFKQNYGGEPLGLTPFLDSVDLLYEFATTPALRGNLLRYVTAKLEGRARELITDEVDSIDAFKRVLRENISPESSEVIRGRIGALRYAYNRQEEFVVKAEELAEGLRRALHIEGMSAKMAHETSIQETVRLCRRSTNSDLVKSILMSSQFKNPKEVIAKLITESDAYVKEQQILRFQRSKSTNNNKKNSNGQINGKKGGQNNNGYNRNRGNGSNWQNNGNNQNRNNNGNGSQRRGNNGGGRGQSNNGNGGGNYNNSNSQGRWQGNNNGANHNVRIAQSGNDYSPQHAPQQMLMGAQFPNYQN